LVAVGLGIVVAYFADARIDGNVRYGACACGLTRATITDGELVLAEANHDTPAGTIVAAVEIKDRTCALTRIGDDGKPEPTERLQVDHLGAKFYLEEVYGQQPVYVVMVDNWKLYPARIAMWMRRTLR
jgi:hypothetical protein